MVSQSELRSMILSNEEVVTKLLTSNEVLHISGENIFISNPFESLGEFLKNVKPEPVSLENSKYVFIK